MASKSLTKEQVKSIKKLILGFRSKLTWSNLVTRISHELNITTTRQTLDKYSEIKATFQLKKEGLRKKVTSTPNTSVQQLLDKIERLEIEEKLLKEKLAKTQSFIRLVADEARSTPLLLDVLNNVKDKILRGHSTR